MPATRKRRGALRLQGGMLRQHHDRSVRCLQHGTSQNRERLPLLILFRPRPRLQTLGQSRMGPGMRSLVRVLLLANAAARWAAIPFPDGHRVHERAAPNLTKP